MNIFNRLFEKKDKPIESYEDFWNWFVKNEDRFFKIVRSGNNIEKKFFDIIAPKLDQIKQGIFYLAGMAEDDVIELVLTADGNLKVIVFIEELVEAAPNLKNWKFTALKRASGMGYIELAGYKFGTDNLKFVPMDLKGEPDTVNLFITHPEHELLENHDEIETGVLIYLDNFLGELNFIELVDKIHVFAPDIVETCEEDNEIIELIDLPKLPDYLKWRQKEFVEEYEGTWIDSRDDTTYHTGEFKTKSGDRILVMMNSDLLNWDKRSSHPWVLHITIEYKGKGDGLPTKVMLEHLQILQEEITNFLEEHKGILHLHNETGKNVREINYVCKEFRSPSKLFHDFLKSYNGKFKIEYSIHKDKYWSYFERYNIQ